MNPNQIRQTGMEALIKALGPVGTARFIQQFETGYGDYTKDRDKWLGEIGVRQAVGEIRARRGK
ncbi:MAG: hypothetical protein HZA78_04250 [Candidatus Schekmanbacteria bacterium]|nr:hypothetical protein [Candidatus Schekmanbacteria bacterium]